MEFESGISKYLSTGLLHSQAEARRKDLPTFTKIRGAHYPRSKKYPRRRMRYLKEDIICNNPQLLPVAAVYSGDKLNTLRNDARCFTSRKYREEAISMLKFFLDKFRQSPGPLKQTRLVVGDVIEELLDLAEHYIKGKKLNPSCESEPSQSCETGNSPLKTAKKMSRQTPGGARKKSTRAAKSHPRELDVPQKLADALDVPTNQKKQEFKVLAILWDAHLRGISDLSAKALSEHGTKLGLTIRHENVRKVIRMQLSAYVKSEQNRKAGTSIYYYQITPEGISHFEDKYLQNIR